MYRSKKPVIIGIRRPSLDLLFFDGNALHTWIYEPLTRVQLDYVCSSWRRYANFLGGFEQMTENLTFCKVYTLVLLWCTVHCRLSVFLWRLSGSLFSTTFVCLSFPLWKENFQLPCWIGGDCRKGVRVGLLKDTFLKIQIFIYKKVFQMVWNSHIMTPKD